MLNHPVLSVRSTLASVNRNGVRAPPVAPLYDSFNTSICAWICDSGMFPSL